MESIGWHHPQDESDQWDGFNEPGIEHFAGSPIRHLAREVNQNSLDSCDQGTVRVEVRQLQVPTHSIPGFAELKQTFQHCLTASQHESEKARRFFENGLNLLKGKNISVLEISDFNTRGMVGPCTNGTPFYAFMKAKGQSKKESSTATGSFGIGKFAPYSVSALRTVFVSTVFKDAKGEFCQLTQGKSILMSHDVNDKRCQGVGFWGRKDRCQPVDGVSPQIPAWIQRATSDENFAEKVGTKLTILGFDASEQWDAILAASVAENFFGAIMDGALEVNINEKFQLNKASISNFFEDLAIRDVIAGEKDEPERFENCRDYLSVLTDHPEVIQEESQMAHLGLCQLRILLKEGLPKRVCFLRNGMFISDSLSLPGLRNFSDFKEFVAVFECKTAKGIEMLRAMEPPRHDDFEPERLPSKKEQRIAQRELRNLAKWVRDMLKRHAKDPISEVTTLDELKEYFSDDSGEEQADGQGEMNPNGKIIIRARPIKPRGSRNRHGDSPAGGGGGDALGGERQSGGGHGNGGAPGNDGDRRTGGELTTKQTVALENVRAVPGKHLNQRRIIFSPSVSTKVALKLYEAGADNDYPISIVDADKGTVTDGYLLLDVSARERLSINIMTSHDSPSALKVVAYEI